MNNIKRYKQDNTKRTRNKQIALRLTEGELTRLNKIVTELELNRTQVIVKLINEYKGE